MNGQVIVIGISVGIRCKQKPADMSHGVTIPMLAIAAEGKQRGSCNGEGGNRAKGAMQDILRLNQHVERTGLIVLIGETESAGNQFEAVGDGYALQ